MNEGNKWSGDRKKKVLWLAEKIVIETIHYVDIETSYSFIKSDAERSIRVRHYSNVNNLGS